MIDRTAFQTPAERGSSTKGSTARWSKPSTTCFKPLQNGAVVPRYLAAYFSLTETVSNPCRTGRSSQGNTIRPSASAQGCFKPLQNGAVVPRPAARAPSSPWHRSQTPAERGGRPKEWLNAQGLDVTLPFQTPAQRGGNPKLPKMTTSRTTN